MALVPLATQSGQWAWAAVGMDSRRARGAAATEEESIQSAVAAVGPLLLIELRDPEGTVTRRGCIVEPGDRGSR